MFPLLYGLFPAFFRNDSGKRPVKHRNTPEKKRKLLRKKVESFKFYSLISWFGGQTLQLQAGWPSCHRDQHYLRYRENETHTSDVPEFFFRPTSFSHPLPLMEQLKCIYNCHDILIIMINMMRIVLVQGVDRYLYSYLFLAVAFNRDTPAYIHVG